MKTSTTQTLGGVAAHIAMRAAAAYLIQHDLDADDAVLTECLKSHCHIRLPQAMDDAKQALGMGSLAEHTFRASMALAGIDAAKECGFPKKI